MFDYRALSEIQLQVSVDFLRVVQSLQPLTLYTSFHDLINVYSRRSRVDNPRGQNFDVNGNLLSLWSFSTGFKTIALKSDFIYDLIHIYSPGTGTDNPLGTRF